MSLQSVKAKLATLVAGTMLFASCATQKPTVAPVEDSYKSSVAYQHLMDEVGRSDLKVSQSSNVKEGYVNLVTDTEIKVNPVTHMVPTDDVFDKSAVVIDSLKQDYFGAFRNNDPNVTNMTIDQVVGWGVTNLPNDKNGKYGSQVQALVTVTKNADYNEQQTSTATHERNMAAYLQKPDTTVKVTEVILPVENEVKDASKKNSKPKVYVSAGVNNSDEFGAIPYAGLGLQVPLTEGLTFDLNANGYLPKSVEDMSSVTETERTDSPDGRHYVLQDFEYATKNEASKIGNVSLGLKFDKAYVTVLGGLDFVKRSGDVTKSEASLAKQYFSENDLFDKFENKSTFVPTTENMPTSYDANPFAGLRLDLGRFGIQGTYNVGDKSVSGGVSYILRK